MRTMAAAPFGCRWLGCLGLGCLGLAGLSLAAEVSQPRASSLDYPNTRTESVTDGRSGLSFADPYRWLEGNTAEVRDWQRAQAKLADDYMQAWPHLATLGKEMARYESGSNASVNVPRSYAGGKWYVLRAASQIVETASLREADASAARVIVDIKKLALGDSAVITWLAPSPDAAVIAFGVVSDGSEANSIHLVDVATEKLIDKAPKQRLADANAGGVQWLPDSSGFFFQGLTKSLLDYEMKTFLHRLRPTVQTEMQEIALPEAAAGFARVSISRDGRWAVVTARPLNPIPFAIKDLTRADGAWRSFLGDDITASVVGHVIDGKYVAVTDLQAPRGRVVAIALDSKTPNDPRSWTELVPQSERVINDITLVRDKLYVSEYLHTYGRVRIFDRTGRLEGEVPLPGNGVINDGAGAASFDRGHPDEFTYTYSSLTQSPDLYRHRPGEAASERLTASAVSLQGAQVQDLWATSSDGTKVPYHVVQRRAAAPKQPRPTLIYGYGGFNIPWPPRFPSIMAAFIDAGGIYVHAHLRGGPELGKDWWHGGRLKNKQNTFDDLYAIANDLIARGMTSTELLAVTGRSNGGLLAGVATVQRPTLWRVAVPVVPILDLIGGLRDPYGYIGINVEYAAVEDPAELRRLVGFSPYHLVRKGTRYPAVYLAAGATDFRTPPWHARKFAARLQAATAGSAPILLRVWDNAGHGNATPADIRLQQEVHWMGFIMKELGMQPASAKSTQ